MDYDRTAIPANYDGGRDHGPQVAALWMDAIERHLEASPARILDLGCGTGRFTDPLSERFDAIVIAVDPSAKMLAQARAKPGARRACHVQAPAERLPLATGSIDVVFMSMSFHHFTDRARAAHECRRVLRDGGYVFVRTGSRERIPAYPYYPFFPASHPLLEEVLPDTHTVREVFERAGLRLAALELVSQTIAPDWHVYADKLATRSDSVLVRLQPQDFDEGMAAVRHHAETSPPEPVVEPIDFFIFRG